MIKLTSCQSLVIGSVEMLVGALIVILPYPGAKKLGLTIIADAFRRLFNGVEEQSKKNQQVRIGFENQSGIPQLGIVNAGR